jgi:hypothetical protein
MPSYSHQQQAQPFDAIDMMSDLSILRSVPGQMGPDNGPEFVVEAVQEWIKDARGALAIKRLGDVVAYPIPRGLYYQFVRI